MHEHDLREGQVQSPESRARQDCRGDCYESPQAGEPVRVRRALPVGLLDKKWSKRQQLDTKLTLESAVNAARNSETVTQQHLELREKAPTDATVEELRRSKGCPPKTHTRFKSEEKFSPKLQVVRQHAGTHPQTVSCARETLQQLW